MPCYVWLMRWVVCSSEFAVYLLASFILLLGVEQSSWEIVWGDNGASGKDLGLL
jgi:hypothetical protein